MVSIGGGRVSISWSSVDSVVDWGVMNSMMSNWSSVHSMSNNWSMVDGMSYWSSMVNCVSSSMGHSTKVSESCEGHVRAGCSQRDQSDQGKSL